MRALNIAVTALAVMALLVITVAMAAQVIWRYVLVSPLQWSEPVAVYALVWLVFIGAAALAAADEHVSIPSAVERLPAGARRWADVGARLATLAFCAIVLWLSWNWLTGGAHTRAPALGFSTRWVKLALPIGFALVAVFTVRAMIADLTRRPGGDDPPLDTPAHRTGRPARLPTADGG